MNNDVVVGVDSSAESLAAVRWAGRYAGETGAGLTLLHSTASPDPDDVLRAAAEEAGRYDPRPEVTPLAVAAEPATALIEASADAGLLVLGAPGRRRFTAAFAGSVATQVVAAAHCPVVVVREDVDPAGPVVVAVDGDGTSEAAVRFAFGEAARRGCALFAVHAWQVPPMPSGAGSTAVMTSTRFLPDAALHVLSTAIAAGKSEFPDVRVHERLLTGHPEQVLPAEATDAALTVVGSRGRSPLTGLLLGSTSQALMHHSTSPVAVVRLPEEPGR